MTYPDAPINLVEDLSIKTSTVISIKWQQGSSNGGAQVIDYRVSYDQGTGIYVVLYQGVTY